MVMAHQIGHKLPRDQTPPQKECPQGGFLLTQVTCLDGAINYQSGLNLTTATAEWNTDWVQWEGWKEVITHALAFIQPLPADLYLRGRIICSHLLKMKG